MTQWSEEWFKPSKKILLRRLSFNFRSIIYMGVILYNYLDAFIFATDEENIINFLLTFSGSSNIFVIGFSIIIIIAFVYLFLLVISNIIYIIYSALLYISMNNLVTSDFITIKKGIFFKNINEIPMYRLTDSQIIINLIDRILGTADVICNTAGAKIKYSIQTLDQENAIQLHNFIKSQIRRISGSLDENKSKINQIFSDKRISAELNEINRIIVEIKIKKSL